VTERTFAGWVAPVVETFQRQRAELVALVRSLPAAAWDRPSPNEAWTYRELLGHLATRDPRDWRLILTAVVTKTPLKPADLPAEEETPINDGLLAEVAALSVDEVARRIESDTAEKLDLLSKLGEDDQHLKQADFPMSLGEALQLMPQHERSHIDQLATAREGATP